MAIHPDASWTHTEDNIGTYFNAVKYSEGGSIWEEVAKAEVTDEPTFIIGVGGLANSTVDQIKGKYIKRINDPHRKIRFLAVDTCGDDLSQLQYLNDVGNGTGEEKLYFIPPATEEYINLVKTVHDETKNKPQAAWCDPFLNEAHQFDGTGASKCRQKGRLYLSILNCYNDTLAKLKSVFTDFNLSFPGSHVRVILIAGVCSGTGSGCIIDLSYLINNAAKQVLGGAWQNDIDAFIYGPIPSAGISDKYWKLSCNHFIATMKEINNFMSANTKNQYTFPNEVKEDVSNDCIFKTCTIVQGYTDNAGLMLTREQVQENLEDYVVSALSKTQIAGTTFTSISSAIEGNVLAVNNQSYSNLKASNINLPTDTGYFYLAMGFKTVRYPIQEIITMLCNSALRALEDLYTNADRIDAEDYLKDLGLLPKGNPTGATPKYSRLDTTANRYQWFDQFFSNYERTAYTMITKKVQSLLPDRKSASAVKNYAMSVSAELYPFSGNWAENIADTVYSNLVDVLKKNPYQAKFLLQDILYSTNKGIFLWMLNQGTAAKSDLQKIRDASNQVCSEIKNNIGFLGIISSDNYNRFRSAAFQVAWADWRIAVWDRMIKEFKEAYNALHEKDDTLFESLVVLFRSISEIVGKDSSSMLSNTIEGHNSSRSFTPMFDISDPTGHGMSDRLKDLIQYTLDWVDVNNGNKTFVESLGDNLMKELLSTDNINKLNTKNQNDFKLAVQEVKKVISELLNQSIQKLVTNILIVFYSTTEYNPTLTSSIPVATVLNELNDPTYVNPTVVGGIDYNAMSANFMANYGIDPFDVAANAIYTEMSQATVCASLTGAGVNPSNIAQYQLFSVMNEHLMDPYITNKIIAKIKANFGADVQINTADSNYTYVHVYAGIPLYAFKGMTEYHTYYTNAVKNGEQGLHMSYGDAIAWGSFPPMVNDLALKIIKAGGNAYINDPTYQSEMQILQEVKDDADAVDQYGFFEDNPNPADTTKNYYAMHYLFDYNVVDDAVVQKVLAAYKADIANAVNTISANSIPITENDPVAYCTSQIAKQMKKTIYDYLQGAGITFTSRDVTPQNFGFAETNVSYSYEKDATPNNNGFGGFYRTLRCSSMARENMKEIRSMCKPIQEQMDAVLKETVPNLTSDLLNAFWKNKEQKEIRTFLEALGQGIIQIQVSNLQIVIEDTLTGKVYPFATNRGFEVQYLLYSVYAGWFTNEYRTNETFRNTLDMAFKNWAANPEFNENQILVKAGENYHNNVELQGMLKKCGIIAGDASPAKKISDTYNISNEVRSAFFDYNDKKTLEENEAIDPLFVNVHLGDSTNFMSDTHVTKAIVRNLIAFYSCVDDIIKNAKLAVPANS